MIVCPNRQTDYLEGKVINAWTSNNLLCNSRPCSRKIHSGHILVKVLNETGDLTQQTLGLFDNTTDLIQDKNKQAFVVGIL